MGEATWCPLLGPRLSWSEQARVRMRFLIYFPLGNNTLTYKIATLKLLSSAVVIVNISNKASLSRAYTWEEAEFIEKW